MIIMISNTTTITITFRRIHIKCHMVELAVLSGCIGQVTQTDI
jgi:hypothetical protein